MLNVSGKSVVHQICGDMFNPTGKNVFSMLIFVKTFTPEHLPTGYPQNHPPINRNQRCLCLTMIGFLIIATVFFIAVRSEDHQRITLHKTHFINNVLNIKYDHLSSPQEYSANYNISIL